MPRTWQELAAAERLPAFLSTPAGVPFVVDPATGRIDVSTPVAVVAAAAEPTVGPGRPSVSAW